MLTTLSATVALLAVRVLYLGAAYVFGFGGVQRHHVESWMAIAWALALVRAIASRPAAPAAPQPRHMRWWIVAGVAIVAGLLYAPALRVPLISDDYVLLDWARHNQFVGAHEAFVRPLPLMLWRVAASLPNTAIVLHATNVILHVVNATLILLLLQSLGLTPAFATIGALVFVTWPTQVEAVTWASGLFDVLMSAGVLTACLLYSTADRRIGARRAAAILALSAAALLTKETAVCLPVLFAVISVDRWMGGRWTRQELTLLSIITIAMAAYLAWRLGFRRTNEIAAPLVVTRYTIKEHVSRCFATLGLPLTAGAVSRHPWTAFAVMAACSLIGQAAIVLNSTRRRATGALVRGLAWALVASLPTMGLLFIGPYLDGSRYFYLPTAGWALYLAAASQSLAERRRELGIAASAIVVMLMLVSIVQGRILIDDWRTAGAIKDEMLTRAAGAARTYGCRPVEFQGLPASFQSAQLLANGTPEAFRERFPELAGADLPACTLIWTGDGFARR